MFVLIGGYLCEVLVNRLLALVNVLCTLVNIYGYW